MKQTSQFIVRRGKKEEDKKKLNRNENTFSRKKYRKDTMMYFLSLKFSSINGKTNNERKAKNFSMECTHTHE